MSTRCQIEIIDGPLKTHRGRGVLLYHHCDGYPSFQLGKLRDFLNATREFLAKAGYPYWWDSERVASVMILLSARSYDVPSLLTQEDFDEKAAEGEEIKQRGYGMPAKGYSHMPDGGVPIYQPCRNWHGDIEYIYVVQLMGGGLFEEKPKYTFKIHVYEADRGEDGPYGRNITRLANAAARGAEIDWDEYKIIKPAPKKKAKKKPK